METLYEAQIATSKVGLKLAKDARKKDEKQKERTAKLQKKRAAVEAFFKPHHNEERKRKFATESKEQVRRAEKLSRTGGGKRGD